MWSQSVPPGQPLPDHDCQQFPVDHPTESWPVSQDPVTFSSAAPVAPFQGTASQNLMPNFTFFQDPVTLTRSELAQHNHLFDSACSDQRQRPDLLRFGDSDFTHATFSDAQRSGLTPSSTPLLTEASSPTLDGARSAVDPSSNRSYSLSGHELPLAGTRWLSDYTQGETLGPAYGAVTASEPVFPVTYATFAGSSTGAPSNLMQCPVHSPHSPRASRSPLATSGIDIAKSKQAPPDKTEPDAPPALAQPLGVSPQPESTVKKIASGDHGPGRKGKYYEAKPGHDGFYTCPFKTKYGCTHEKTKLKCNYDKYVDSHLKPYRCHFEGCEEQRFSSTACRLRHEREAHGSHGHGVKPYLCAYPDCERSKEGSGFPRSWNRNDHMKRVHDHCFDTKDSSSTCVLPEIMSARTVAPATRKRSAPDSDELERREKRQMVTALPSDLAATLTSDFVYAAPSSTAPGEYALGGSGSYRQFPEPFYYFPPSLKAPGDEEMMRQLGGQMVHYDVAAYASLPHR